MSKSNIVDFNEYGLNVADDSVVNEETIKILGRDIIDAVNTFGFCYLMNHGVTKTLIDEYLDTSRNFFEQPAEVKREFRIRRSDVNGWYFGWLGFEGERLDPDSTFGDLHETFSYQSYKGDENWPAVDRFEILTKEFFKTTSDLAYRICDALSLGLGEPRTYLRDMHQSVGTYGNSSGIRLLYYPCLQPDWCPKPEQARLGEHIDCGTLSFIFQDEVGGLEVKQQNGEFIHAEPIPDTMLLLLAGQTQILTSNTLKASVHRILVPTDERRRNSTRKSINYILYPDNDLVINAKDRAADQQPMTSLGYLKHRIEAIQH